MSERQLTLLKAAVYVTIAVAYMAVVLSVADVDLSQRARRTLQWARYYRWLSTRAPVPGWVTLIGRSDLPEEAPAP
jgi:bacteriorhodopsin